MRSSGDEENLSVGPGTSHEANSRILSLNIRARRCWPFIITQIRRYPELTSFFTSELCVRTIRMVRIGVFCHVLHTACPSSL